MRLALIAVLVGCPAVGFAAGTLGGCQFFPNDHIFNTPINTLPPDPSSGAYITAISGGDGSSLHIHLDLSTDNTAVASGGDASDGIPYNVFAVTPQTTWSTLSYTDAADESDCGDGTNANALTHDCSSVSNPTMPIPPSPNVEGEPAPAAGNQVSSGDGHLLVLDTTHCGLWESGDSYFQTGTTWSVFSSAFWDLSSNKMRPAGWTSGDAAGFPILPLLLRVAEAATGSITHAHRVTFKHVSNTTIWPASHQAGTGGTVPMGQLFRLKNGYTIPSTFNTQAEAMLQSFKTYGIYVSDTGSNLFIQGEPSSDWDTTSVSQVQGVTFDNFEAVDITAITALAGFDATSYAVPGQPGGGGGTGGGSATSGSGGSGSSGGTSAGGSTTGGAATGGGSSSGTAGANTTNTGKKGCASTPASEAAAVFGIFILLARRRSQRV